LTVVPCWANQAPSALKAMTLAMEAWRRPLGDDYSYKDAPKLMAGMDAALKAFGPVEPRKARRQEPFPFQGVGVRPDGSVDLALYRCYPHQGKPDGPHLRDAQERHGLGHCLPSQLGVDQGLQFLGRLIGIRRPV
jgi:hypothetical protein